MTWILRAGVGVALLGIAVLGGWACSDDDGSELSLEEYFQELQALDEEFNEQADAAFEGVGDEPEMSEVEAALGELSGLISDFAGGIEDLSPPEEAQEAHDAAVEAGNATADAYDSLADAAGDAESIDELFTGEAGQAAQEALDQFTTACLDLQQIADENSVEASLNCGDDEG
jgi:hypothetical protein